MDGDATAPRGAIQGNPIGAEAPVQLEHRSHRQPIAA
jgi:hypothetical protein